MKIVLLGLLGFVIVGVSKYCLISIVFGIYFIKSYFGVLNFFLIIYGLVGLIE